ncbi:MULTISPECIES: hypothetical protein [Bacteroides]|uniref:hypothetical protein n=1 Tax=Bacteroides TaxID=816 RepID=UPI0004BC2A24|nr:hypothetical protein [Bacteroides neonati]
MANQLYLFEDNRQEYPNGLSQEQQAKRKRVATMPLKRKAMNRKERLDIRDRMIVARLYYWREIVRKRLDDVLVTLSDEEFCVEERTINNAWAKQADYFEELCRNRTTARQLQKMYPSWRF